MKKQHQYRITNFILTLYFFISIFSNLFKFFTYLQIPLTIVLLMSFFIEREKISRVYYKILLIVMLVFSYQSIFIIIGILNGYDDINTVLNISRYLAGLIVFPVIYGLIEAGVINSFINTASKIITTKIMIVFSIILIVNFIPVFSSITTIYLDNFSKITPYPMVGFFRVFDSFSPFFPLILLRVKSNHHVKKVILHLILLTYLAFNGSIGVWASYALITFFINGNVIRVLIICTAIAIMQLDFFSTFLFDLNDQKQTSLEIKNYQYDFIFSNLTILGNGVGYIFNLQGRIDILLENLYLYWLATYGIFGFIPYLLFFIVYPIYVTIINNKNRPIFICGVTYASIAISSVSNPFLMSGASMLMLTILIASHIRKIELTKYENLHHHRLLQQCCHHPRHY